MFRMIEKPVEGAEFSSLASNHAAPNRIRIPFDANLIKQLKCEHRTMRSLLDVSNGELDAGKTTAARKTFCNFKRLFHMHLLKENLKLFTYLEGSGALTPQDREKARRFQADAARSAHWVDDAARELIATPWGEDNRPQVQARLQLISDALSDWIEAEEASLYPLYECEAI